MKKEQSIKQRKSFPYIVLFGAILSGHAGYINAVCLKSAFRIAVSHMTGSLTRSGFLLTDRNDVPFLENFLPILAFVFGASITGATIGKKKYRYGAVLILEGIFLFITAGILENVDRSILSPPNSAAASADPQKWALLFAAAAMGLQNSLFATYSGDVVRTTHFTGILTDIGQLIGQMVRYKIFLRKKRRTPDYWRLYIFIPIILGFWLGAIIASEVYDRIFFRALYVPACTICLMGVIMGLVLYKIEKSETYRLKFEQELTQTMSAPKIIPDTEVAPPSNVIPMQSEETKKEEGGI